MADMIIMSLAVGTMSPGNPLAAFARTGFVIDVVHMRLLTDTANMDAAELMSRIGEQAGPVARERRRHPREPVFTAGVIFPPEADDDEHRRDILVFNVSCGGLGFRSQTQFVEGTLHGVRIGTGPLHLSGRVKICSCRPRPDGSCDVGAEFL